MSYVSFFDFNLEKSSFLYDAIGDNKQYPNFSSQQITIVETETLSEDKKTKTKSASAIKGGNTKRVSVWGKIHEDWTFEMKTNFQSYAEAIGGVSGIASSLNDIINKLRTASTLASGKTNVRNDYNKFMVWKDTEPINMSTKLVFETQTNPYYDVYLPTMLLLSRTTLTPSKEDANIMIVPGFFVGVFKTSLNANGEVVSDTVPPYNTKVKRTDAGYQSQIDTLISSASDNGKLISNFSVGFREINTSGGGNVSVDSNSIGYTYRSLISFSPCYIQSVKPTFSKDRTTSGIPLRAEVEVSVQSLFSASDVAINTLSDSSTTTSFADLGSAAANIFR
jgi:hypothetical protein